MNTAVRGLRYKKPYSVHFRLAAYLNIQATIIIRANITASPRRALRTPDTILTAPEISLISRTAKINRTAAAAIMRAKVPFFIFISP